MGWEDEEDCVVVHFEMVEGMIAQPAFHNTPSLVSSVVVGG